MKKILVLLLIVVMTIGTVTLIGCEKRDSNTIVIGYDNQFPPMGFKGDNGVDVGFDLDLAREVGKKLGKNIKFLPINWKQKELELKSANIDLIWNGYTITDKRKKQVNFSNAYLKNEQVIVVKKDSPNTTIASLEGKKLIYQSGSSAAEAIASNDKLKNNAFTSIDDNMKALTELSTNQGDAWVVDYVLANYVINQDNHKGKYMILEEKLDREEYGIGIRKKDTQLLADINKALQDLADDGTLKVVADKWGLGDLLLITPTIV